MQKHDYRTQKAESAHAVSANYTPNKNESGTALLLVPRYEALALPFRSNKQREAHAEYVNARTRI